VASGGPGQAAAVREHPLVLDGADLEPTDRGHTRPPEDRLGTRREIQRGSALPRRRGTVGDERRDLVAHHVWHLVTAAADRRPDHDRGATGVRAERGHRGKGLLQHPDSQPGPSGMGGSDDSRVCVGEQHRQAVRGEDRQRDAR
jgi:hypothetical protein